MPTAAKRKRSIARKCAVGGAKLRLKVSRSGSGSELVRCRASRPVAGGLYKAKKTSKRKAVKNGSDSVIGTTRLGKMLLDWRGDNTPGIRSVGASFSAGKSAPIKNAKIALAEMKKWSRSKWVRSDNREHARRTASLLSAAINRAER